MEATPALQADQAEWASRTRQQESGVAFVDWPTPETDTRSFGCSRCGTAIERGALVRGLYDEKIPGWLFVEAPLVAIGVGYLVGWLLEWGEIWGIIAGVVALAVSGKTFFSLHHDLIENRKLADKGLPRHQQSVVPAATLIASLIVVPCIATLLYRNMGWVAMSVAVVVMIAIGVGVETWRSRTRREALRSYVADSNRRQNASKTQRRSGGGT
jgi:hypothetical protein